MKTIIHSYWFDTKKESDKQGFAELSETLTKQGLTCFETWGGKGSHYAPNKNTGEISLDTGTLFNDQWNSDKGRVFDWAQDYPIDFSKSIKKGHWLEQTNEMLEIRRNTAACGYCGKQEPMTKGYTFCPHCLDSVYLKKSELHLLRMQAIDNNSKRVELSQAEFDHLYPLYKKAQLDGITARGISRIKKARADIENELQKSIYKAQTKHDGILWLLNNSVSIENVIYYDHRDIFSFGWRNKIDAGMVSDILENISEFPFSYEILCSDGKTLTGN